MDLFVICDPSSDHNSKLHASKNLMNGHISELMLKFDFYSLKQHISPFWNRHYLYTKTSEMKFRPTTHEQAMRCDTVMLLFLQIWRTIVSMYPAPSGQIHVSGRWRQSLNPMVNTEILNSLTAGFSKKKLNLFTEFSQPIPSCVSRGERLPARTQCYRPWYHTGSSGRSDSYTTGSFPRVLR